jgi:hypothetical protein
VRSRVEQSISRRIALLAVVGLHLLGGLLIGSAFRVTRIPQSAGPTMVWLGWPDPGGAKAPRATPIRPQLRKQAAQIAAAPVPRLTTPLLAAMPVPARPASYWRLEAERAAAAVLTRSAADQQRDALMGSTPQSPFRTRSARPAFPWSRQPLGKYFDADPHTGIVSLHGKRCTLAFFLILPGFGCAVGPLDPEPGRGDLFDPKYQPQPLELPDSLSTEH